MMIVRRFLVAAAGLLIAGCAASATAPALGSAGFPAMAGAASLVRHPNVVTLYEVGEVDDWFLLVLSPQSVRSAWVKHELVYALQASRYRGRIIPVLSSMRQRCVIVDSFVNRMDRLPREF